MHKLWHKGDEHVGELDVPSSWLGQYLKIKFLFLIGFKYPEKCKMFPNYDKGTPEYSAQPVPHRFSWLLH